MNGAIRLGRLYAEREDVVLAVVLAEKNNLSRTGCRVGLFGNWSGLNSRLWRETDHRLAHIYILSLDSLKQDTRALAWKRRDKPLSHCFEEV